MHPESMSCPIDLGIRSRPVIELAAPMNCFRSAPARLLRSVSTPNLDNGSAGLQQFLVRGRQRNALMALLNGYAPWHNAHDLCTFSLIDDLLFVWQSARPDST